MLHLVEGTHIANVWVLVDPDGRRFLVDTGHPLERRALLRGLAALGVRGPGDLAAILLTHRHSDHAGNAAWLKGHFACPLACHPADAAILREQAPRPRLSGRGAPLVHEILCRVEDSFPARAEVDEVYAEGTWRWGFEVIPVPGHTEGSVLLHHRRTGVLFTGDALLTGPPAQRRRVVLRLAVPAYSADVTRCHRAVLAYLARATDIRALGAGHGPKVDSGVAERLEALVKSGA